MSSTSTINTIKTPDNKKMNIQNIEDDAVAVLSPDEGLKDKVKKEPPKKFTDLLDSLVEQMVEIDFWEESGISHGNKLRQKHYMICVVERLLKIATENNWDMCKYNETIYLYNQQYWGNLEIDEVKKFLSKSAEKMGVDKFDAKHYSFVDKLYQQFMFSSDFQKPDSKSKKVLVNLRNGTFEVDKKGSRLIDFKASDFLTYQLDFDYYPLAECPKFSTYLDKVLPDKASQNILSEYIGYVFTKHLKLEKCLLLYGTGGNGKSVFFDVINAMLGEDNISNISLSNLEKEHYRAQLANKLINYASEISGSVSVDLFKKLASIEPVDARHLYGKPFVIRDYAKLMFNANELPKNVEHNEAYFRRFLIIPFITTISEEDKNINLAKEIISEELSGVFNWVVEGLTRLLNNQRFTESAEVTAVLKGYRNQSDNVYLFIEEKDYKPSEKQGPLLNNLYEDYRIFCINGGYTSLNRKNFKARLIKLGFRVDRTGHGMTVFGGQ